MVKLLLLIERYRVYVIVDNMILYISIYNLLLNGLLLVKE